MAEWSGRPAYLQVADDLRARIRNGTLAPGSRLPSLADLMREYGVSITVVRIALSELRSEKVIYTHQGKGSFVREDLPDDLAERTSTPVESSDHSPAYEALMTELKSIHDDLQRMDDRLARVEELVSDEHPRRQERPR